MVTETGKRMGETYDSVRDPVDIAGRVTFCANLAGSYLVIKDGLTVGRKYTAVIDPKDIAGRLFFKAEDKQQQFVIDEKGEAVGGVYEHVSIPQDVKGHVTFWARKNSRYFIVNEKGLRHNTDYDEIYSLTALAKGGAYVIARKGHCYVKEMIDKDFFGKSGL